MTTEQAAPLTVPAALARAARLFPDNPAYVEGAGNSRRTFTWGELARRVEEVAAGLVALGLNRGDRVAICAENSIDWIVAYHAIAASGAAGVLVYFDLKSGEISGQIGRPGCRFLFASEGVLQRLGEALPPVERVIMLGGGTAPKGVLPLDMVVQDATPEARAALPGRAPSPDDLATIIYTSGTTGGAKGVMLSHRNLLSNAHSAAGAVDISAADSVLLVLPLHHGFPFLATIILPALLGARVGLENDLRRVRDRLQEFKPTIFFGVPALFELMYRGIVQRAESEGRLAQFLAWQKRLRLIKRLTGFNLGPLVFRQVHQALGGKLRFLVSGGAALNPQTALDFFSLGLPLLQGWGMTEASPAVALQRWSKRRFLYSRYYEGHAGSVGPTVPGVEVKLIDVPEKNISVEKQGDGEVLVRGANVFQGYWQAPDETASAMLDGWLRTGDLGRITKDGSIYLTGRSKYIIVLDSGEKVYPDELENKLLESAMIEDVCITGRRVRDKTVVTAVIYASVEQAQTRAHEADVDLDAAELVRLVADEVDRLGRDLAAYKRVARIELVDEPLPKTPIRKVARGLIAESYMFDFDRWLASGPG